MHGRCRSIQVYQGIADLASKLMSTARQFITEEVGGPFESLL